MNSSPNICPDIVQVKSQEHAIRSQEERSAAVVTELPKRGDSPSYCSVFYGIMKDGDALFGMVDYCHVKAMAMRWRTRDLRKAGIIVAGVLLLLGLMAWVPLSVASAHQVTPGVTAPGTVTVQATPTVDATVTALSDFHYSLVDPRLIDFLETVRAQDEEILDQIALDLALDLHSEMGLEPHF